MLLGQHHLVRSSTDDDHIERVVLVYLLDVAHGAQCGGDLGQLLRRGQVGQVEHLHHRIVEVAVLGRAVGGNEDGVGRERFPERLGGQGQVVQRFLQCGVVHFETGVVLRVGVRAVLRIEDHVDARHLAHRLIEDLGRLVGHAKSDGLPGNELEFRGRLDPSDLLYLFLAGQFDRRQAAVGGIKPGAQLPVPLHDFQGALDFLFGDARRRVHGVSLLEFGQGLLGLALLAKLLPRVDVPLGGLEAGPAGAHLVADVAGIGG